MLIGGFKPGPFKPGPCPFLDDEGICAFPVNLREMSVESGEECPYGCTAEYRKAEDLRGVEEGKRMAIDKVYVLCRLLITTGWARVFADKGVPFMVERTENHVTLVRIHVTPWVQAEFYRLWPPFWGTFSEDSSRGTLLDSLETDLYRMYHAKHLEGPAN